VDPNNTPEDVATLYSWANLHEAKYKDFSASRAQTREKARQRVQESIEAERRRMREEAEAQEAAEAHKATEAAILAEAARKQEEAAKKQAKWIEAQVAQQAAQQCAWQPPRPEHGPVNTTPAYQPPQAHATQSSQPDYSQPVHGPPAEQALYTQPVNYPPFSQPASQVAYAQPANYPGVGPWREDQYRARWEHSMQVRTPWSPAEIGEPAVRPAWLAGARVDANT
jgi:hypothetical protein